MVIFFVLKKLKKKTSKLDTFLLNVYIIKKEKNYIIEKIMKLDYINKMKSLLSN